MYIWRGLYFVLSADTRARNVLSEGKGARYSLAGKIFLYITAMRDIGVGKLKGAARRQETASSHDRPLIVSTIIKLLSQGQRSPHRITMRALPLQLFYIQDCCDIGMIHLRQRILAWTKIRTRVEALRAGAITN